MGLFDQMFGTGAAAAQQAAGGTQTFDQLKQKYQTVLSVIEQQNVQLQNLHVQDNKLYIRGVAPSEDAKNAVWDQIKVVDPNYGDLTAEISVDESADQQQADEYTVKPGDSLWKIAQKHYGDGNEYMKIFYANRDKMDSPNSVIHPGDVLRVPSS